MAGSRSSEQSHLGLGSVALKALRDEVERHLVIRTERGQNVKSALELLAAIEARIASAEAESADMPTLARRQAIAAERGPRGARLWG